jgi:hypothetical protein
MASAGSGLKGCQQNNKKSADKDFFHLTPAVGIPLPGIFKDTMGSVKFP